MSRTALTLLATGDLILPERDPDWLYDETRQVLQSADVVVGHVESFNTLRGHHATAEPGTGYPPRHPRVLEAIPRAGFHMATMAHNHTYDGGPAAIEDTRDVLRANGMLTTGAGAAYVHVLTHYENEVAGPGLPPTSTYTFVAADSLNAMHDDIAALRERVDIVTAFRDAGATAIA